MLATSLLRRAPRLARIFPARLLSTQHPFRYSKPEYLSSHGASVNPETFEQYQLDLAKEHVHWFKEPTVAVDVRPDQRHDWFPDGTTNMSYNCLDRHLATRADQPALSYYSAVGGENRTYTYAELHDQVGRAAQSLLDMGVKTGDAVLCYLPMIPQSNVMMLACARIGAVHSVVFGGFAAKELAVRIKATKPSVIVSADFGRDGAKVLPYMPAVNEAIEISGHTPPHGVVVVQRPDAPEDPPAGLPYEMTPRDHSFEKLISNSTIAEAVHMKSNDPLYTIFTSGTTGDPKGVLRDHSHLVPLSASLSTYYGVYPGETMFAASDIGWVVGHCYITYGPLLTGAHAVMFEGKPVGTPDATTYWKVIEKYKATSMFTAPTALRAIRAVDPDASSLDGIDISSLRAMFVAGERADPNTINFFEEKLKIPVVDHWWQTESGTPMCGMQLEDVGTTPGSCGLPLHGYDMRVLDPETKEEVEDGVMGSIAIKLPMPPGFMHSLFNNHPRFVSAYMEEFPGYYDAGDAGFRDENGYLHIMERTDDAINVAGHRISTGLLEETVLAHPDVPECAVVGVRDEIKGMVPVCVFVRTKNQKEGIEAELVELVREKIGAVAALRTVVGVRDLPKTRSGKILRQVIRKIIDGDEYKVPGTVLDAGVVDEIAEVLAPGKL